MPGLCGRVLSLVRMLSGTDMTLVTYRAWLAGCKGDALGAGISELEFRVKKSRPSLVWRQRICWLNFLVLFAAKQNGESPPERTKETLPGLVRGPFRLSICPIAALQPRRALPRSEIMLKRVLPILLAPLLLGGCPTTLTHLTP